jgi:hypothetical protein
MSPLAVNDGPRPHRGSWLPFTHSESRHNLDLLHNLATHRSREDA